MDKTDICSVIKFYVIKGLTLTYIRKELDSTVMNLLYSFNGKKVGILLQSKMQSGFHFFIIDIQDAQQLS